MSILEAIMMVCFGLSWPISIYRTYKVKNPLGKSTAFLWLIIIGYIAGSTARFMRDGVDTVFCLYIFDMLMVMTDTALCLHYRSKNALAGKA